MHIIFCSDPLINPSHHTVAATHTIVHIKECAVGIKCESGKGAASTATGGTMAEPRTKKPTTPMESEPARAAIAATISSLLHQLRAFEKYGKVDCVPVGVSVRFDGPATKAGNARVLKLYCCTCPDGKVCQECYINGKKVGELQQKPLLEVTLPTALTRIEPAAGRITRRRNSVGRRRS